MAYAGFPDLIVSLDGSDTTLDPISSTVTTINGWKKSQIVEEVTAAGNANEAWAVVGINKVDPIVLTGPYNNDDPSLWFQCQNDTLWGVIRTIQFEFEAADTQKIESYIVSFEVNPERSKLHAVVVTLQPTGAVT